MIPKADPGFPEIGMGVWRINWNLTEWNVVNNMEYLAKRFFAREKKEHTPRLSWIRLRIANGRARRAKISNWKQWNW